MMFFFECNGLLYVCVCIKVCISMKVRLFFYSVISVNLILIFYHFLWFFDSFLVEGKLGIVLFFPSIHFVLFVFRKLLYIIFFWNIYGNFSQIFGHIVSCLFFNSSFSFMSPPVSNSLFSVVIYCSFPKPLPQPCISDVIFMILSISF